MRVLLGVLALALVLGVGTAGASPDPYRDQAEAIACPAAPAGWESPPESEGGRSILTPLTAVQQTEDPTVFFGAPVVQVTCDYRAGGNRSLQVSVRYALPIDLNPWNDFYIGCTSLHHPQSVATAAHAWNERERVYRVVGAKTWSLATFIDDLSVLRAGDVPRFEAVTRAMLAAAQPFAHDCRLSGNSKPVGLKSIWSFSFDVRARKAGVTSSARSSGSFVTTASASGAGTITNLRGADFRLTATGKGKTRRLTLRVGSPLEFRHGYGTLLRTELVVLASNDSACRKGAKGTLLLSLQSLTPPRVALQVCGQTYLDGNGRVQAQIQTT